MKVESKIGGVFVFMLTLGTAGMILHLWIAPLILMVVYLLFGLSLTKRQWNRQSFADSLYYMGFSFTLIALLISINPLSDRVELEPNSVLRYMAIALATTVFGLISRTIIVVFRKTIRDQDEEVREDIKLLSDELLSQLKKSIEGFQAVSSHIEATLNGNVETIGRILEDFSKKEQSLINETIDQASAIYSDITNSLREKMESIQIPDSIITEKIEESIAKLPGTLDNLNISFGEISKELKKSSHDLNSAIKQVGNRVSISSNRIMKVKESFEKLDTIYEAGIHGFLEKLDNLDFNKIDFSEKLKPVFDDLEKSYDDFRDRIYGASSAINSSLTKLNSDISDHRSNLSESLTNVDIIGGFGAQLEEAQANLKSYNINLKGLVENLNKLNNGLINYTSNINILGHKATSLHKVNVEKNQQISDNMNEQLISFKRNSESISKVVDNLRNVVTESIQFINKNIS